MEINLKVILIGLVALASGVYLQLFGLNLPVHSVPDRTPEIEGFFWPDQKVINEFEMVSDTGSPFVLDDLKGKWRFMFFGYTHCPDICPITMNNMRQLRQSLEKSDADLLPSVEFVFVSVDGERDTPEVVGSYVGYFGDGFVGVTGNKDQVDSLAIQLGVPYSVDEHEPGNSNYLVGHTAAIFLISPEGKLAAILQPPHSVPEISESFLNIIAFTKENS